PIGKPVANMQIYVVDQKDNLCPVGVMGELWVSGVGVGRGYLNDAEKTAKVFRDNPFTSFSSRLYKTGDLGRWLSDGSLEFLGRKDDQVKIRGHRIELGEIESVLSSQAEVTGCCVQAKSDSSGMDRLVGYVVMSGDFNKQILQDQLEDELPSYMVPTVWVCLEELPLTVHGKIDKKALPDPDMSSLSTASYVAASTKIEEALVRIWQDLLGVEQVGVHDNFFELGGHSLLATRLVAMIRTKMNLEVQIRTIFTHCTISELTILISKTEKGTTLPEIVFQKKTGKIPLSFSQERLWFIDQLEGSLQYHMPIVLRLEGAVDKNILEKSFRTIVARHEVLRTVIQSDDGIGYQEVIPSEGWGIEVVSLENSENISRSLEAYLSCPFDLSKDYMLRMCLFCLENNSYVLAGVFHHIANDGWSDGILVHEFVHLYNRFKKGQVTDLPPLKIQYSDYALWQREHIEGVVLENELTYWTKKLKGTSPLVLPTDFPRPSVQSTKGADFNFSLNKELQDGISKLCKEQEVTTFMMLLAAFKVVLSKYSGQEDISVGTPIANRTQQETQDLIGFFVNTLVVRSTVHSEVPFLSYLEQVKETTLQAYENQFAPFEKVVERVVETRDMSTSPLFQVLFVFQDKISNEKEMSLDDVQLSSYGYDRKVSSFDITLAISEVDSGFEISIAYCVDLFTEETIHRLAVHYRELLRNIVNNAELKINELSIITKVEEKHLLYELNPKNVVYPEEITVLDMFRKQVGLTPDDIALVYGDTALTYQELDIRTDQLAIYLQEQDVSPNTFVGICVDRSLEMIIGILGILKSGGAYVPISPDYPEERIKYILEDTAMQLVLSSTDSITNLGNQLEITCLLLDKDWRAVEAISGKLVSNQIKKEDTAYVIYTSGSTGTPKGVAVSHGNLESLAFSRISYYGEVTSMILLPSFVFDPSVSVIVGTLLTGGRLIIPESTSINDASAMKSLLEGKMDLLLCVPTYYQFLLDEKVLDNTVFRGVILGGESLSSSIVSRHFELYPDIPIYNEYGPTECTVWSTVSRITEPEQQITIGKPIDIAQIYIVDEFQNLVAKGVSGEICISGGGVSKGYLNQDALTQEVFVENPFISGDRMYRTGDIARWLPDGTLEFLGRKDDQVKIRGYRIELGEIENILSELEGIKSCCVLARADDLGMNRLIGYVVSTDDFDKQKTQAFLKERLPEYMVPQLWVVLDEMPLTSNGKVDKGTLPEPQKSQLSEVEYIAPRNDQEKKLVLIWEELLGVDKIGINDNFFELGGHSLLATRLVSKIRKEMELEITIKSIFSHPKIADLSSHIENQTKQIILPKIIQEERIGRIPLSFSQERLWFIDKLEGSIAYNLPIIMNLKGKLNVTIFEACFKEIVSRHEVLRTVIKTEDGIGYQEVLSSEGWKLDVVKLDNPQILEALLKAEISRPFDLSKEYMFRMKLFDLGENTYVMAGVFHHISSDGWSNSILVQEFTALYEAYNQGKQPDLPELPIQYADYALWQRKYLEGDVLDEQLLYWKEKLQSVSPLYLPMDYPRPSIQNTEGANNFLVLSKELSLLLKELCEKEGVTLFMLLLTTFKVLLHRYSGQDDICVGTPIANRTQEETEGIIGFFVNTLALRSDLSDSPSFIELLEQVKQVTLDAYNHQAVPFEKVVDAVVEIRDRSITPLFQTMFTLQNTIKTKEEADNLGVGVVDDLELSSYDLEETTAQFDMTLTAVNSETEISFNLEYCTALFKKETIERMLMHYKELLFGIAKAPEMEVGALPMLVEEEKHQVLHTFNTTNKASYLVDQTILDLLYDQVNKTPDNTAVIFGTDSVTYTELHEKSNQLAAYILAEESAFIGICIGQSIEMIIGILGILKAGKTYIPIDPNYPKERIDYILEDAGIQMVLTNSSTSSVFSEKEELQIVVLDVDWKSIVRDTPKRVLSNVSSEDLAYVIYTSGTTGNPKGVLISHHSLYDYALTFSDYFELNEKDKIIQQSSLSFDTSIEEIFPILVKGGSLCVVEKTNDFEELLRVCERERITILSTNPYLVQYLNAHKEDFSLYIRALISGGDVLKPEYISNIYQDLAVYNTYGPTESTVCISYHKVTALEPSIPIGKPIANRQVYILNAARQLNPIGVIGELFVGGSGLAKGYLNKPELTKQQFVSNPFNTEEILYKTGDMCYRLSDGSLIFSGRKDTQVNIRGYRIELGEIESVLASVKLVSSCCVLARTDAEGHPRLVGYVVSKGEFDKTILQEALRKQLPEYMVPKLWMSLSSMPLNHNGKIDKKALPNLELTSLSSEKYVAPSSDVELNLAQVWKDLLGVPEIGIHDNFFDLGGDSIITIQVVSRLKRYGYHLQPRDLFEHQTISALSEVALLKGNEIKGEQGILAGESILLPIQQWYFEEAYSQTAQFNQSIFVAINKQIKQSSLELAVKTLVSHHDALRFRYVEEETGWKQHYDSKEGVLEIVELQSADQEEIASLITEICTEGQQGLTLEKGDIFKVILIKTPEYEMMNRLFIVSHHLIVDGVSWRIILDDFNGILEAVNKEEKIDLGIKGTSYREWGEALKAYAVDTSVMAQLPYWKNAINAYTPLSVDKKNEGTRYKDLIDYSIKLDAEYTAILLKEVHQSYGTEIDDILLCCLVLTISKWTNQDTVNIGMEGHGREYVSKTIDISRTVGWFTSLYPVSLKVGKDITLGNLIKSIKEQLRCIPEKGMGYGALRYLHPLEDIRNQLSGTSWDIVFNYLGQLDNTVQASDTIGRADESVGEEIGGDVPFYEKLAVNSSVAGGELIMGWSFSKEEYEIETIEKLAESYLDNLKQLIAHCKNIKQRELTPSDYGLQKEIRYDEFSVYAETLVEEDRNGELTFAPLYRLSPLQEGMLFHGVFTEKSNAYVEQLVIDFSKPIDTGTMKKSWDYVIQNHSILRSAFIYGAFSIPLQRVHQDVKLPFEQFDYNMHKESEQEVLLSSFLEMDKKKGFEFSKPPLMRITIIKSTSKVYKMVFTHHHIVMDGWSLSMMMGELMIAYETISKGEKLPKIEEDLFEDYIKYIRAKNPNEEEKFWKEYLGKLETPTLLPFFEDSISRNKGLGEYKNKLLVLDSNYTEGIKEYAQKNRVTVNTIVQWVWALLLSKYTGNTEVVYGVTVSGRPTDMENSENKIGLYINTLPLCASINHDEIVVTSLQEIQKAHTICREHQYTSLATVQHYSGVQGDLFDSILVFENYPISEEVFKEESLLEVKSIEAKEQTNYPLTITVSLGRELEIDFSYNTSLLSAEKVTMIKGHFNKVLEQLLNLPDAAVVSEVNMLSDQENELLGIFNDTSAEYPKDKTVIDLFTQQVINTPDAIAVVYENEELSYKELDKRSNQLARYLREQGVVPNTLVGICLERSLEMLIGILGILKSGGAYVPIDPAYPKGRIDYMITDAGIDLVLSSRSSVSVIIERDDLSVVLLDSHWDSISGFSTRKLSSVLPNCLAYVIYTSGSTGKPKGVMIEHSNVTNLITSQTHTFNFDSSDVVLQFSNFVFDASVEQIFIALCSGSKLVLINEEIILDPVHLLDFIDNERITHLHTTPSMLSTLPIGRVLQSLKRVVVGGEICSKELMLDWSENYIFYNEYGPTETTVTSVMSIYKEVKGNKAISIGNPIGNTQIYIMNEGHTLLPIGVVGELCIGGAGVTRGYLNQEELTKDKFVSNPFVEGDRIYKTGDLARWLPDGTIEFIGRKDDQVKIRGYRIELGEIENALSSIVSVTQCCVLAKEDVSGTMSLVGYVVVDDTLDKEKLQEALRLSLPEYMVPMLWVEMEVMPLNSNGKLDKKSLPDPDSSQLSTQEYVAPQNETEEQMVVIWQELLKVEMIGVQDNFFELGGHSILAMKLISQINKKFSKALPIVSVFEYPTIKLFSEVISSDQKKEYTTLIPLNEKGEEKPIFCVHPLGGTVIVYKELSDALGDKQPFYAFQSSGLDGLSPILKTVEEMAAIYIKEMQKIDAEGPYRLAGYSFGGEIAFEMTMQLEEQGFEVEEVLLFDVQPPIREDKEQELKISHEEFLMVMLEGINKEYNVSIAANISDFENKQEEQQLEKLYDLIRTSEIEITEAQMRGTIGVIMANEYSNYQPPINSQIKTAIKLFKANEELDEKEQILDVKLAADGYGWKALTTKEVKVFKVSGNHLNMLNMPYVADIVKCLQIKN
ncbi:amino acid adenylation domain-containing protein, partial [Flavivirga jejuensis]